MTWGCVMVDYDPPAGLPSYALTDHMGRLTGHVFTYYTAAVAEAARRNHERGTEMTEVNPKETQAAIDGKVPLDYLEPVALLAEAPVMKHGADKYGRRNFRDTPMKMSTYVGALQRHTLAWAMGEDTDPESGFLHLAHIRACCAVMLSAIDAGTAVDDRHFMESTLRSDTVHVDGDMGAKGEHPPPVCCLTNANHTERVTRYCFERCWAGGPRPKKWTIDMSAKGCQFNTPCPDSDTCKLCN